MCFNLKFLIGLLLRSVTSNFQYVNKKTWDFQNKEPNRDGSKMLTKLSLFRVNYLQKPCC